VKAWGASCGRCDRRPSPSLRLAQGPERPAVLQYSIADRQRVVTAYAPAFSSYPCPRLCASW
jgi:hypothetical protein